MKTAKEILAPAIGDGKGTPGRIVEGNMPMVDLLPRLLDTGDYRIGVRDEDEIIGEVDAYSMLRGLGELIQARDDSSIIEIECAPADYSASRIAMAVEDTDTHLVDLWTSPGDRGMLRVNLRVRRTDPSSVAHSLERYGYDVVATSGEHNREEEATLRLLELNALLGV